MVFWEMREGWGRKFWSISGLLTLKRGKTWLKWGSIQASSLWFPSPHPRRSCRWLDFNETFNWQQVHRWGFVSDRSCEGSISGVKRQLLDSSMKGVAFLQSELLLNESFWKKWVWKKNLKLVEAVSYPEVQIFCSILFLNWFFNAWFVSFVQFADLQLIPKRTQLMEWS